MTVLVTLYGRLPVFPRWDYCTPPLLDELPFGIAFKGRFCALIHADRPAQVEGEGPSHYTRKRRLN
jgi:hypothetical protein